MDIIFIDVFEGHLMLHLALFKEYIPTMVVANPPIEKNVGDAIKDGITIAEKTLVGLKALQVTKKSWMNTFLLLPRWVTSSKSFVKSLTLTGKH